MVEIITNSALAVLYEPIVLQSHYTYKKKSFIDKITINQGRKEDDSIDCIDGMLIIDEQNKRLIFKPSEIEIINEYYQENFQKKMSIAFNNIKSVIFVNKNNEYIKDKSSESINKAYPSFVIYCYDFRVYSYNRKCKLNNNDAIKFFQYLLKVSIEKHLDKYKYIIWKNKEPDKILSIYHKTVQIPIDISLEIIDNILVLRPKIINNSKDLKNFKFGPQIVYYSPDYKSYLLVVDKSCNQKFNSLLFMFTTKINVKKAKVQLFYLNNDSNDNKSDFVFPTTKELNEAFEKLFSLCTPRNKAEFKRSDKKWLSKLSECGWLSIINRCIELTKVLLKTLNEPTTFVYMVEIGCPIWGFLFGSLVQIICQPFVRTIAGFISMLEKNWILSGAYRNGITNKPQLFLLFLDCVYQLLRSSPFLFQFTEEMLICLYDLFIISPPGFMSSQDFEFKTFVWNQFFQSSVVVCLTNKFYNGNNNNSILQIPKIDFYDYDSFWFKMYARWIPYVQVEGGSICNRHYFMITSIDVDPLVYSNYPFSLNYDTIQIDNYYNNNDDTRSINTIDGWDD